jgi:hypothetical protein
VTGRNTTLTPSETRDELAGYAELCRAVLGPDLTAFLTGGVAAAELGDGSDVIEETSGRQVRDRLRLTAEVIEIFAAVNQVSLVVAWLREVGAVSGESSSPAELIREASDDTSAKPVIEAAIQYAIELRRR